MSSISRNNTRNYGGISKLMYCIAPQSFLDPASPATTHIRSFSLSQAEIDESFFDLAFMHRTANHDHNGSESVNGVAITHDIEATFHRNNADIRAQIALTNFKKCILIYKDNNGEWYILWGLTQLDQYHTGKEPKDLNSYTISWRGSTTFRAIPLVITA